MLFPALSSQGVRSLAGRGRLGWALGEGAVTGNTRGGLAPSDSYKELIYARGFLGGLCLVPDPVNG